MFDIVGENAIYMYKLLILNQFIIVGHCDSFFLLKKEHFAVANSIECLCFVDCTVRSSTACARTAIELTHELINS